MPYHEKPLGKNVRFLLPSLKLMQPARSGESLERSVHAFLVEHFGGYTATSASLFGFWRDEHGQQLYGEHREFVVALPNDEGVPELKEFLASVCRQLREECLYFEMSGKASLLYPDA
ncbi:MAG: hypothetical protein PW792_11790 [Acidobacteriaceae bacterium]|nr:hypothetical protein [Acidobacteriaceae bacterium]